MFEKQCLWGAIANLSEFLRDIKFSKLHFIFCEDGIKEVAFQNWGN